MNELYKTLNPVEVATRVILEVMQEAENGQHTPGSWTKEGALHHLRHACVHVEGAEWALSIPQSGEDWRNEARHALCRLAMALYCHEQGDDGDHGPEGSQG